MTKKTPGPSVESPKLPKSEQAAADSVNETAQLYRDVDKFLRDASAEVAAIYEGADTPAKIAAADKKKAEYVRNLDELRGLSTS